MRRSKLQKVIPVFLAMFLVLLGSGTAMAASTADAGFPWWNFFFRVVNCLIVAIIIMKFFGEKIGVFFFGRRISIKEELAGLEDRQRYAEKKLQDVEKQIANLDNEIAGILKEAQNEAENIRAIILKKANEDAEIIHKQAQNTAQKDADAIKRRLRSEIAEQVVLQTTHLANAKLDKKDHERIIEESLSKVVFN